MQPIVMTLALVAAAGFFAWTANRRWAQLFSGAAEPRFTLATAPTVGELFERVKDVVVYALGQKRMPQGRYRIAGLAHMAIFGGFSVLTLNTVVLWGRGFDPHFDLFGLVARGTLIGDGYSLVKELFAAAVLLGCAVFVYYRVIARNQRMTLGVEGLIILGIISTMMLADFLYVGAETAREARIAGVAPSFRLYEPISSLLAIALGKVSNGWLRGLEHSGFWWHSGMVLFFGNLLPYSKHFHIITSFPNAFTRNQTPRGQLPFIADIEGKIEREEPIGIRGARDLTWKDNLDLYTCTECGRCSDNCPAYITDKKLSPKHLTLALRDHLYDAEKALIGAGDVPVSLEHPIGPDAEGVRPPLHTTPPAPAGGYFRDSHDIELVPNIVHPDVIWACTTCRACEEHCPVMITYVDKIVQMRRDQVMSKNEFPPQLEKPFRGMETNGNPWNLSRMSRADWAQGLDVPVVGEGAVFDVLYWVGCAASYDDRAKKVARATAQLLQHAGVKFAILATEENCTGDPARRAGNEYLFQMLAQGNVETLNGYGLDAPSSASPGHHKKPIVTACPHCFNTLLNEYPQLGGKYEVVHHTDFLNGLIARGLLVPEKPVAGRVVYHDSCYLGRYNDVYDSPREILAKIPGVELVEVPYWNKNKGLCCGAGGAQMFMEEQNEHRVNKKRTLQLLDTGATTLSSGCPFCMTMLSDGLKAEDKEEEIKQLDVAEMLALSVDFTKKTSTAARLALPVLTHA